MNELLFWFSVSFVGLVDIISLLNLVFPQKLKKVKCEEGPLVSIIIPMRNETKNVNGILDDIRKQDYRNIEVVTVDDDSDDKTLEMLEIYKERKKTDWLKIVHLDSLDKNWVGKSHAIYKGLLHAKGQLLFFVDADIRLEESAIGSVVDRMREGGLDVMNCFPKQMLRRKSERLITPLMSWISASFMPYAFYNKSGRKAITFANGQFIACTREMYLKSGGHEKIKGRIDEDVSIINIFKKSGAKVEVLICDGIIKCFMYDGYLDARKGFSRSIIPSLPNRSFIIVFMLLAIIFIFPFVLVFFDVKWFIVILEIWFNRAIASIGIKENVIVNILLHPLQFIVLLEILIYSIWRLWTGNVVWKGRTIKRIDNF